jgi:hypothetical protein
VIARSGLPFAIARPACCESCIEFPTPSFNEGNNTSAPLIYLMMKGELQILAGHVPLDLIPTDYVVAGMILALAELIEGTSAPVYQLGASDVNPCTAQRFGELVGLYKRKYHQRQNALLSNLWARLEPSFVTRERFEAVGPPAIATVSSREVASFLRKTADASSPPRPTRSTTCPSANRRWPKSSGSSSRSAPRSQRPLRLLEHPAGLCAPVGRRQATGSFGRRSRSTGPTG